MECLNAKRYRMLAFGDVYYVTVSYTEDGEVCEILTNFPPECNIPNREQLIINALNRSWTMLLDNGISMSDIIRQSLPYNGSNDKFINDMVLMNHYG